MSEIGRESTRLLLAKLDDEIERKCIELQEKHQEEKLKRTFFTGCIVVFVILLLQVIFKVFNVNSLLIIFVFQAVALLTVLPVVFNLNERIS